MKKTMFWTVVLGLALTTSAWAKGPQGKGQGQGQGQGHGKGNPHAQMAAQPKSHGYDDDRAEHGKWERRGNWEYMKYSGDHRPPGWSKGKKTGWGNCDLPPGQAKKYGSCNVYRYQGRDHYWYRDEGGLIIVRRPVISAHAGVDIH